MMSAVKMFCSLILATSLLWDNLVAAGPAPTMRFAERDYVQVGGKWFLEQKGKLFPVVDGILTLRFRDGASGGQKESRLASLGLEVIRVNKLGIYDVRCQGDLFARAGYLSGLRDFEFVEVTTRGEYLQLFPDDPYFELQWGLHNTGQTGGVPDADVDAPEAWEVDNGDPSVIVGVIDSGTEFTHEDLSGNMWTNQGEIPDNGVDDDGNGFVDDYYGWDFYHNDNDPSGMYYHGTHVAGVVAAVTNNGLGVAGLAGGDGEDPGCLVMPLAVGDNYPEGSVLDDAIIYAVDNGARIITMSLSVGQTSAIDLAIEYAYDTMGVFIDCAAGNDMGNPVSYPANLDRVMAVGASEDNDQVAYYSSCGPELEVIAPGTNIYSTQLSNSYGTSDGTSFAAPHVAALAALILSVNPSLANTEVRKIILDTSEDIDEPGHDPCSGWGRINANNAMLTVGPDEIRGIVRNNSTGNVMDSVLVEVAAMSKFDYSDRYGFYSMRMDFPESVQVSASFVGYSAREWVEVVQGGTTYHDVWMVPVNPGYVAGYVRDIDTGEGIEGVATVYSGHLVLTYVDVDPVTGWYAMEVPEGTWTLTVDPENPYLRASEPGIVVVRHDTTYVDFDLTALTQYSEVGESLGIQPGGFGQGVSFTDYDGDGDEDIFVANLYESNRFYRNLGGNFEEIAAAVGLAGSGRAFAGVWADADRDGDPDLFVTQRNGYDALYRNDGGMFVDVAAGAGVRGGRWDYSQTAAWMDVDNDGWVDLYVANRLEANNLYRNLGGTFEDVARAWGVANAGESMGVSVADFDNDGDSDIYVVNSGGASNALYRNDGGYFTDVAEAMGVDHSGGNGRGSCWADMDGDGDMDLFVADAGADVLYRNDGTEFVDVTAPAGLGDTGNANGASFLDYDNDGDTDLVVATETDLLLYLNNGAGAFVEVSDLVGLTGGLGVGVAGGDIEGDGDVDLYVARSDYVGDLLFSNQGNNNTWLNVRLLGSRSDKNGIGARIDAWAGTSHNVRDVVTGMGLYSQDSITSEIGLLREASVDSLMVTWPSGRRSKLTGLAAEQTVKVREAGPVLAVPGQIR